MDDGILVNEATGYQPMEYMRGNTFGYDDSGQSVPYLRDKDRVSFSRPGIFGHCDQTTPALFMQNLEEDTCVLKYGTLTEDTCRALGF